MEIPESDYRIWKIQDQIGMILDESERSAILEALRCISSSKFEKMIEHKFFLSTLEDVKRDIKERQLV